MTDQQAFNTWVDQTSQALAALGTTDLQLDEETWHEAFDDGLPPQEGAQRILFQRWLREVDALLEQHIQLRSNEVDDWGWAEAYEAGETPENAVDQMLSQTLKTYGLPG